MLVTTVTAPLIIFANPTKGIFMAMSKGEQETAGRLRVLIQTVREYDHVKRSKSNSEKVWDARDEMLKAANDAEAFLNRAPEESI